MKAMTFAAAASALILAGIVGPTATAGAGDDPESAFTLDLTPAGGSSYHIHCAHNAPLANCQQPSLWENTNRLRGLQTHATATLSGSVEADTPLLG